MDSIRQLLRDLLYMDGLCYLRFEQSMFGFSVALSIVRDTTIYHVTTTDGEVSLVAIDDGIEPKYEEFESFSGAIKFLQSAIDKS